MMQDVVYPRYTHFERMILGIIFLAELPFRAMIVLAAKCRERYCEKWFLG